jgi:protein O-mannosyl-transferase
VRIDLSSSATAAALDAGIIRTSRPPAALFVSQEKRTVLLCLVLGLLTLAFYNPVVHNQFTNMDDDAYITSNAHVQAGLTWETVKWAFTSFDFANWHPLTWLSHALDCQLFKLNPVGHHYENVLLHAVNVFLLFLLLQSATGVTWSSFLVAALFAVHPVNVESVAWAAERKNVLSMLFFLLTLLAYDRYARQENVRRYLVVVALFALGLMAKPEIITLPFVLLLWDYWPLQRMGAGSAAARPAIATVPRSFTYLLLEKTPLLLIAAGDAVITVLAQKSGNAVRYGAAGARFANALVAYTRYLGKAFWPARLVAFYPLSRRLLGTWQIAGSTLLLIAVTAAVLHWRSRRYLAVGWFWFLGTLVPVIGLVEVGLQAMADRYAYLSLIGLFICVVWGLADMQRELNISPVWFAVASICVLGTLGMLTRRQITYWHDSETLWRHTLNLTDQNYFAHTALAMALEGQGRSDEAIAELNASEALQPYSAAGYLTVGAYEQAHGRLPEAIGQFQQSLNASSDAKSRADALAHMGSVFLQMGDASRATSSFQAALTQDTENSSALVGMGLLAERNGDFVSAASQLSCAMKVQPTDVGFLLLAEALRREGRVAEAGDAAAHARQLSRNITQAEQTATQVMAGAGIRTN